FYRASTLKKTRVFVLCTVMGGLILLFGAGEEISWGQRIFGFDTPEAIYQHNAQGEMNLHNLKFGEYKINKIIFSQLLGLMIFLYFIPLPFLYRKKEAMRMWCERLAFPVARNWQILLFILAAIITTLIQEDR